MVNNAVPMIRGRIERIELHWNISGVDDVVIRPRRDEHGEACANPKFLFNKQEAVEIK